MVVSVAAAAQADGSPGAMDRCTLNNSILPASDELRTIADPIQLFGQDYNDCNGILSAMTPSHVAAARGQQQNRGKRPIFIDLQGWHLQGVE